ncbi:hypothetical protein SpCBS45565_g04433 [Spizellomyces sp. 'palustris']|nr:hypothetical protein SpCBS45565_g04433 [Spizellomyces sp. 'palustris']
MEYMRPVISAVRASSSDDATSTKSSVTTENPLAKPVSTSSSPSSSHLQLDDEDADLQTFPLCEPSGPASDSEHGSIVEEAWASNDRFVPYRRAITPPPVTSRRAATVDGSTIVKKPTGPVSLWKPKQHVLRERVGDIESDEESDGLSWSSGSSFSVGEARRGVYIPSEFRAMGEGPKTADRTVTIDEDEEQDEGPSAAHDSENNDVPSPLFPSSMARHVRQETPPPVPTKALRPALLRSLGAPSSGHLNRWKVVNNLAPPNEVIEEDEEEGDATNQGSSHSLVEEPIPTPLAPAKLKEGRSLSASWRPKMSLFHKSSSGRLVPGASEHSMTVDSEERKKPPAHLSSQTTLSGSQTSLTGSQTNLAVPKPAEPDQAPVKHKWFRPLRPFFPKLYSKDTEKQQMQLHPLAHETTVHSLTSIEPTPESKTKHQKSSKASKHGPSSAASRSRTKETPLLKRLMMRKEKAASNEVAPTSDPGKKRQEKETRRMQPYTNQRDEQNGVVRHTSEEDISIESMAEQQKFESRYRILKRIGTGGHSTVRLAQRISDGTLVVCKFIRETSVWHWHKDPRSPTGRIPLEVHIMRQFIAQGENPGIIRYIEHYCVESRFIIVMEYLGEEWVDLYDFIEMYGPVEEEVTKDIFGQIVETLQYVHWSGYVHNDIKDENIMINTRTRQTKLIDFGSATPLRPGETTDLFYGTKKFSSPEAVQGLSYYPEAQEVWALGTLLYVLLFKMDPFKDDDEIVDLEIVDRIEETVARSRRDGRDPIHISPEAVEVLKGLMDKDWGARMRIGEIMNMRFFQGYHHRKEVDVA